MRDFFFDLETRSPVPIKNGTHAYAEKAQVLLWAYALEDDQMKVWDVYHQWVWWQDDLSGLWQHAPTKGMAVDLEAGLRDPENLVWGHNAGMFDFVVLKHAMPQALGLISEDRRRDTMVQAFAHSLPGALDKLGEVLQIDDDKRKIADGKKLMRFFCVPNADGSFNDPDQHPEKWLGFVQYAGGDIVTMREVRRKVPSWNYKGKQVELWHTDMRINNRGFALDMDLVNGAIRMAERVQARLAKQAQAASDDEVMSATQRDVLKDYLESLGVDLPDLRADTLERRMDDPDLPAAAKELIGIRLAASMNSVAKYKTTLKGASSDGRMRGTQQFRGAGRTGRWAHRLVQPGNLPRPQFGHALIEYGIDRIKADDLEGLDLVFPSPMSLMSSAIRGAIVAGPGKKLCIADLSNIEGRVAAWLAGEEWKLQAFRDFDSGEGHDLYILAYAKSFNVPPEDVPKKGPERQIGKVEELMFQYGGGVGAWITGAATYGIDLDKMTEQVWDSLPTWAKDEAEQFMWWLYEKPQAKHHAVCVKFGDPTAPEVAESEAKMEAAKLKVRHGLPERTFIACDAIKRLWRRAHPEISSYWKELEDTVRTAIATPGVTFPCRKVKTRRDGAWLRIGLPSGRALCYPNPKVEDDGAITYTGFNQYTRQWGRVGTYGGKLCIAGGTLVLTRDRAWVPIENITSKDRVWDGDHWVRTAGKVSKGRRPVIQAFGAWMTEDHEVLTTEGWKRASQSAGHHRFDCRLPDGVEVPRQRWAEIDLDRGVRMWGGSQAACYGVGEATQSRNSGIVRLYAQGHHRPTQHEARHVDAPGIRSVAGDGGPMPSPFTSRLGKLWRAWHSRVQALAGQFRQLLGRHGADVPARVDLGTPAEQRQLHPEELRVGDAEGAGQQPPEDGVRGWALGAPAGRRVRQPLRHQDEHLVLQVVDRSLWMGSIAATGYEAEVFDLVNCGPRNRFVIVAGGKPLIVHNCENITQAVACDQFAECLPMIEEAGYMPVLGVHDEWLTETPDTDEYSADALARLMCSDLGWNAGLPLAAAGMETYRYKKD